MTDVDEGVHVGVGVLLDVGDQRFGEFFDVLLLQVEALDHALVVFDANEDFSGDLAVGELLAVDVRGDQSRQVRNVEALVQIDEFLVHVDVLHLLDAPAVDVELLDFGLDSDLAVGEVAAL